MTMGERPPTAAIVALQEIVRLQMADMAKAVGPDHFDLIVRLVVRYWPRKAVFLATRDGKWFRAPVEAVLVARVREEFEARRGLAGWRGIHQRAVQTVFRVLFNACLEDELLGPAMWTCSEEMARGGVEPL